VTWSPVNLANLEEREPVTPSMSGLVYPGRRHVWSGAPESGKTLVAYLVGLEHLRAGGTVAVVDFEMGPYDARDRLRDLGATVDDFARLLYVEPEGVPASDTILGDLVDEFAPTLVVIDAAAGAYDLQGLDDNKRADAEWFARALITPLWQRGIATVTLDHVTKNSEARGKYAIGSERKVGGADVHLGFEAVVPLGRGRTGLVKIVTHKDRFGYLPRPRAAELELRSDRETHAITWTWREPEDEDPAGDTWRPTQLMQRVSEYLAAQGEPVSRNAVEKNVTGQGKYLRQAIDALVADGHVRVDRGPNRSHLLTNVTPFSASEFVSGSSQTHRGAVRLGSSPPFKGDEPEDAPDLNRDALTDEDELERLLRDHSDIARGAT
jgi:hypothetical protein